MQKLLLDQQYAFDDSQIGKTVPVLFEKPAANMGQIMGRTPYLQPVHVEARCGLIGQVARCGDHAAHRQQPAWSAGLSARRRDTTTLEFPDNKLLAALGGPHASHFARLEQKLTVGIDMRGNLVAIDGKERERAGAILRALYARLEAGESITQAEVDAEIRFTDGARANAPGAIKTARRARCARARPPRPPIWT